MSNTENYPILENWAVVWDDISPWRPPEGASPRLKGTVYGHREFEDGATITTTRPVRMKDDVVTTASGSHYRLGAVDKQYEALYPCALGRLRIVLKKF